MGDKMTIEEAIKWFIDSPFWHKDHEPFNMAIEALEALEFTNRAKTLLKATYDILKKCDESYYVLDVLEQTAVWDGCECDGYCLMEEIEDLLGIEEGYGGE